MFTTSNEGSDSGGCKRGGRTDIPVCPFRLIETQGQAEMPVLQALACQRRGDFVQQCLSVKGLGKNLNTACCAHVGFDRFR
jgi:hypothetical protein